MSGKPNLLLKRRSDQRTSSPIARIPDQPVIHVKPRPAVGIINQDTYQLSHGGQIKEGYET